jgi:holo-[acyl-carrier protein] synthase
MIIRAPFYLGLDSRLTDMQILGMGTDLVEISRFRDLEASSPFFDRVFSEPEQEYCRSFSDSAGHFAATFAAKEACFKALPHGVIKSLRDIEILRDVQGAPHVHLPSDIPITVLVSLSHTSDHAVGVALSLPDSSSSNILDLRKLLNGATSEIHPE